jgi:hypothetical protein
MNPSDAIGSTPTFKEQVLAICDVDRREWRPLVFLVDFNWNLGTSFVIGVVDHYFSTCPLILATDSCSGRFVVSGSGTSNSYPTSASSTYVCEMCDGIDPLCLLYLFFVCFRVVLNHLS